MEIAPLLVAVVLAIALGPMVVERLGTEERAQRREQAMEEQRL